VPIGLTLLFLTGVGPAIAWRKATASHLRYQFTIPVVFAALTLGLCFALGLQTAWAAVVCFTFCAFVTAIITQEFVRGVAIRRKNTGSDALSALMGMVIRGKRRYGGYVVHVGIVLMFLGFAGSAYQKETEASMVPGQEVSIGRFTVRFDKLSHEEDRQKEMITAEMTALVDGKPVDRMRPARWFFRNHENEPTTEVAIRRTPAEDLYLTLGGYDLAGGTANLKLVLNPIVNWIWLGFILLALGTGISVLPDAMLEKMTVKVTARGGAELPGSAAGLLVWLAVGLAGAGALAWSAPAYAQAPRQPQPQMGVAKGHAPTPSGDDEAWLVRNIMCQCGTCRHTLIDCAGEGCGHATNERLLIRDLLGQGKTRDEIIQFFIQKYGSQVALASPIDKGFNRLAWLLPYSLGVLGAGGLAYGAYRLARRSPPAAAAAGEARDAPPTMANRELQDKLDDELRVWTERPVEISSARSWQRPLV
jgi:cytochrome c-type biogenesis protein CcmF